MLKLSQTGEKRRRASTNWNIRILKTRRMAHKTTGVSCFKEMGAKKWGSYMKMGQVCHHARMIRRQITDLATQTPTRFWKDLPMEATRTLCWGPIISKLQLAARFRTRPKIKIYVWMRIWKRKKECSELKALAKRWKMMSQMPNMKTVRNYLYWKQETKITLVWYQLRA